MYYTIVDSPIDPLLLVSDGKSILRLRMMTSAHEEFIEKDWQRSDHLPVLQEAREQLDAYFGGQLPEFDLPLRLVGTEFQKSVWTQLLQIPFGKTINYGELAERIGNTNAQRAVGAANGRNPIAVIVPCHRVIGANGSLTGFGGGIKRKEILLDFEKMAVMKTICATPV